jgi:hypothetical protein
MYRKAKTADKKRNSQMDVQTDEFIARRMYIQTDLKTDRFIDRQIYRQMDL